MLAICKIYAIFGTMFTEHFIRSLFEVINLIFLMVKMVLFLLSNKFEQRETVDTVFASIVFELDELCLVSVLT